MRKHFFFLLRDFKEEIVKWDLMNIFFLFDGVGWQEINGCFLAGVVRDARKLKGDFSTFSRC